MLDAQFFGVAQRRERVFLVVNTRDWRRAAPVLFERESLCWDSASSREKRETLTGGTANVIGNADSHVGECLTPGESQARRVYAADGVMPTLNAREHGGQNQQAVMLDSHQQDGRFKVSNHPEVSNTLTSHMGTGGNNVPLVKAFKWNQGERSRSLAIGDVSPTLSTDHNPAVYEIARREGRADHIPVMTSNGDDVFPALCATDGSKRFIDNQSINGGRLLIDRRRT